MTMIKLDGLSIFFYGTCNVTMILCVWPPHRGNGYCYSSEQKAVRSSQFSLGADTGWKAPDGTVATDPRLYSYFQLLNIPLLS